MDNGRKEYTFFWIIENYTYCWHQNGKKLLSPYFRVDELEGTTWRLMLYPRGMDEEDKDNISLFLERSEQDDGPEKISLNYELLVLSEDESDRNIETDYEFEKGEWYGYSDFLEKDEILLKERANYLPQDILTICCRLRNGEGNVRSIGQSTARTRIRIEKNSFLHVVKNFNSLQPNVKQTTKIRSHSKKERFISSYVDVTREKIMTEIVLSDTNQILCKCEISLLDESGNLIKFGMIDNIYNATRKSIYTTPLSLSMEEISNRKSEYLPEDKLSLWCECIFSFGIEFQTIEEILNDVPLSILNQKSNSVPRKNEFKASEKMSTHSSVSDDMKSLYINQCLTDVEVKTETSSFRAHKIVLCARSPVFKAMMTNDMKEKNTDCIRIDDLENDIVQQLLLFLYSDNIENLCFETACKLFYAADKYQIGKLKEVCCSFLVENLTTTNAGELLLLADTHNDSDLKKSVEDFILAHEEQVFGSKEWDKVAEANPLLGLKTMQLKYKKNTELN